MTYYEALELFEIKDGLLKWKNRRSDRIAKNLLAGYINNGYFKTIINGKLIYNHRIMFMLYNKRDIENGLHVDHIDGNKLNNTKDNLRLVTNQENQFNRTKAKGYTWDKQKKKWRCQIKCNGKNKHIGYFTEEEDARMAYLEVKEKLHKIEYR